MWIELIAFGGVLFWIAIASVVVLSVVFMTHDNFGGVTFVAVASLIVLEVFSNTRPLTYAATHLVDTLLVFGVYVAVGMAYATLSWVSMMYSVREIAHEMFELNYKNKYETIQKLRADTTNNSREWQQFTANVREATSRAKVLRGDQCSSFPPSPTDHKGTITGLTVFWPFDFLSKLLTKPFEIAVRMSIGFYHTINKRIFKDFV